MHSNFFLMLCAGNIVCVVQGDFMSVSSTFCVFSAHPRFPEQQPVGDVIEGTPLYKFAKIERLL